MANTKISALTSATTPLAGTEVLPIVQSGSTVKVANNDLRPKQIQSNATSGVLQIVGPAAAATRVMTVPDANFTAARTDAAQSFTGVQTFSNGFVAGGPGVSPAGKFTATGGNTQITLEDATNSKLGYLFQSNDVLYYYNNALTKQVQIDADFKFFAGNFVPSTAAKGINFTANSAAAGMTSQLLNWYEEGTWTPVIADAVTGGNTSTTGTGYYTRIGRVTTYTFSIGSISTTGLTAGNTLYIQGIPYTAVTIAMPGQGIIATENIAFTGQMSFDGIGGVNAVRIAKSTTGAATTYVKVSDVTNGSGAVYGTIIFNG